VDATGVEVGTEIQITSDVAGSQYVDLVWSGSEWGMTWDRGSITFARAQADGTLIGSPIAAFGTWGTSYPTIVWAGSLYGTAYNFTVSGDDEVYYGRISGEGSVLGSVVHVTNALEDSYDVDLAWSGSLVGVVWEDGRTGFKEIFFQRLDGAAGLVGPNLQVTSASNSAVDPSIAWDGSLFTIVWGDQRSGNYELYMTQISASGVEVMSDLRLSDHPAVQVETELEFSGSSFGVLWQDYRSGSPQAYFDVIDRCQ
jgi:hypothetical protein